MPSVRDIGKVIQDLLEIIPEDQTVLRKKIIDYNDNAIKKVDPRHKNMWNQAPEIMNGVHFGELAYILNEYNPVIDTDWKKNVVKVFNNQ